MTPDKLQPQDISIEKEILGILLMYPDAILYVSDKLVPNDFYATANRLVYAAIIEMHNSGIREIDLLTVTHWLNKDKKTFDDVIGGPFYISLLTRGSLNVHNIEYYVAVIKSLSLKRDIILKAQLAIRSAFDEKTDGTQIIDTLGLELMNLNASNDSTTQKVADVTLSNNKRIQAIRSGEIAKWGIPTLLTDLDALISGLKGPDLVVIAGRPGQGKTALAVNLLNNISVLQNIPSLFFSLEMSSEQLELRLETLHCNIPYWKLQNGNFDGASAMAYQEAQKVISKSPILFDDNASLTVESMRTKAIRAKYQHDIKIIFIDYLQLLENKSKYGSRENEVSGMSRSLKKLAKELNVPVIVLSQLNRDTEKSGNGEPKLHQLRESGSIEQDADQVIMLWRPSEYGLETIEKQGTDISTENICVLGLEKHRNGPTGKILTNFYSEGMKFTNYGVGRYDTIPKPNETLPF